MEIDFQIKQFEKFYFFLMNNAPKDYIPWFFPLNHNGKDPSAAAILNIDSSSKGSWHHECARLTKEQCIEYLKKGYNIGLSARTGDPLIIIDIDEAEYINQTPTDTLTATSRKRAGTHSFCWDKDGTAKINLPTDSGEIRSDNQYVVACGSYVPFNLNNKKDKEAYEKLPSTAKEDELLGYYTIRDCNHPKPISFNELPKFFREKEMENINAEAIIKNKDVKEIKQEGKYSELFNLKVSDILDKIPEKKRVGHPLHESDTDANFSLSEDGSLAHCWRHLVSLNAVQYLCVKAGYKSCVDCGTPHKGRGISKIKGDKKAFEVAYKEALKMGLIKKYVENNKKDTRNLKNINRYVDEDAEILIEQVCDKNKVSKLCMYNNKTKKIEYLNEIKHKGFVFIPQEGEEIEKGAVILPSKAEEYDEDKLDEEIKNFVNKWLDVPDQINRFGVWNTKRSWVYDKFHTLNYLRALGDTGVGKSRYLNTFGFIHYTPIFTTGATTAAPLFRILDKWKGTLVMDEADLKNSDESDEIIKIINQGFEKGSFIMRCDQNDAKRINFFEPYSPKILATRRTFTDKATESRCITHVMSPTERKDIEVNLNKSFYNESETIRNKLLMWRFKNYFVIDTNKTYDLGDLEPRVRQIVSSYVALFGNNETQMKEFQKYIKQYQEDLIDERQSSFEGSIIGAIHFLLNNREEDFDAKRIIEIGKFEGRNGKEMQPRSLNSYLKSLGFKKSESRKVDGKTKRCIPINQNHIQNLFTRYGYEVTEVTIVTVTSDNNNIDKKEDKTEDFGDFSEKVVKGVPHRNNRNNRNSVTEKELQKWSESDLERLKLAEESDNNK